MTTEVNAAIEPTDRSSCPAVRSSVPGAAMIPMTEIATMMFSQLSQARKYSDLTEKKIISAARNTSSAVSSGIRRRSGRGGGRGSPTPPAAT